MGCCGLEIWKNWGFFMIMELKQVINVSYKKCHMKCYLLIFDFTKMGQLSTT